MKKIATQKLTPSVGILVFDQDKVLLVKHEEAAGHLTGIYGLPGGRVEDGETEKATAIRELREETGLVVRDIIEFPNNLFFAKIERKGGEVINFAWRVFLVTDHVGDIKPSAETLPEWVQIDKISSLPTLPNVEDAVERAKEFLGK